MRRTGITTMIALVALLGAGCAQERITLPDGGGTTTTGECGGSYPGSQVDGGVGDAGMSYGFGVGETAPCAIWESVRVGAQGAEPNTHINLGELFLQAKLGESELLEAKWGVAEARAIVIAVSALNCGTCPDLLGENGLAGLHEELDAAGAVMIGVCRHDLYDVDVPKTVLTLEEADEVLIGEDGWLEEWHRTNDQEMWLPLIDLYPQWAVIRVSDMQVVEWTTGVDADQVLSLVQNIDAQ